MGNGTTVFVAIASAVAIHIAVKVLLSPLRDIPGPWLAKVTDLWRLIESWRGRPDISHNKLHEKYGPAVRIGPNCVSISDPALIKTIFSTWKKDNMYTKVRCSIHC